MKIRYYLRGLGLGILFTAVFFLLGGDSKQTMSDEMIKERAKELGMIENTVLADIGNAVEVEESIEVVETETILEEESTIEETTVEESVEESTAEETEEEEESTVEETVVEEEIESSVEETMEETSADVSEESRPANNQIISIVVNRGEGSDTVSRRLYEAGLVDDPYAYDKYLMQNGYDRKIGAGEHLIPAGSSWQEIAQILCS